MTATPPPAAPGTAGWTRALCWATVTLEGFDIVALSASLPTILDTEHAGIGKAEATFITTISLVGILVGALLVGPLSDRVGRKASLMGSIALFSVLTLRRPVGAGRVHVRGAAVLRRHRPGRLHAGRADDDERDRAALAAGPRHDAGDDRLPHRRAAHRAVGLVVMPDWEWLFVLGGVVGLAVLPVMWVKLPETSERVLARRTGAAEAERVPLSAVLRQPFLVASLATWVASFMGLLLVYGLISWLPTIMNEAGYKLSTSLVMLFLLNLGGVVGLVLAGLVGDSRGIRPSAISWFLAAAVFLGLLSVKMPTLLLDVAVFVTGVFVFSAQVLVYAWITRSYPSDVRGTALGLASGIGRVGSIVGPAITGALVTAGVAYPWGFYFFSARRAARRGRHGRRPPRPRGRRARHAHHRSTRRRHPRRPARDRHHHRALARPDLLRRIRRGTRRADPGVEKATGAVLGSVGAATSADLDAVVAAAHEARHGWAAAPYQQRAEVLLRAAALLEAEPDRLVPWLVREAGSAPGKAGFELGLVVSELRESAAAASAPYGQLLRSARPRLSLARYVPVGVVGVISPFNFPGILSMRSVAPALALGNAVVLKPDPRTTVAGGMALAGCCATPGCPTACCTCCRGSRDRGELVAHPDVPCVSFTGSTAAGTRSLASPRRCSRSCTSSSAATTPCWCCPTPTSRPRRRRRLGLVPAPGPDLHDHRSAPGPPGDGRGVRRDAGGEGRRVAGRRPVGRRGRARAAHRRGPARPGARAGHRRGRRRGPPRGGRDLRRAALPPHGARRRSPGLRVAREEIFGPVAPVVLYDTLDEAVELVNDDPYGLSVGLLTDDAMAAYQLSSRLEVGMVHVNDQTVDDEAVIPFAGIKASGSGGHFGGARANLETFGHLQWVTMQSQIARYPF